MFSPQPHGSDVPINPAARRRLRPSRPTSRIQQGHARSGSVEDSTREGSPASFQLQDSDTTTNASVDTSVIRKQQQVVLAGKEQDVGSTDLTKNEKYRVLKLPAVPKVLSDPKTKNVAYSGTIDSQYRYGLLVDHNHAIAWEYAASSMTFKEFKFPFEADGEEGKSPFPLGAFVSPSANSPEPGLVIVLPISGRIAYWDAVGTAVSEGLLFKIRAVQGKIPMMTNEVITAICNAEPAGFIASTSSGRLIHLALRDNAGRPHINPTIMRGTGGLSGLFGALRAGSNRRDVAAVRAGKPLGMGEREIIVCTERGIFSRWHVSRSGSYANTTDVDFRDQIWNAMSQERALQERNSEQFQVIDFQVSGYNPTGISGQEDDVKLLVLTGMITPDGKATYALVSLELSATGRASVDGIYVIKSYANSWQFKSAPKLYLPEPKKTAFVVFDRAVAVISKMPVMEDEMLEQDAYYEDVVDFRGDLRIEIIGSGPESVDKGPSTDVSMSFTTDQGYTRKIKNPGVVLVAKGVGILRIEAFDVAGARQINTPVTVKSKLEQAVFFGTKSDNPLNFNGRLEVNFHVEDLEEAALEVSKEILRSRSPYLPAMLPSLGSHLELRAQHLRALITFLKSGHFGAVSKQVSWRLLQDAEKCEAARALWDVRNERLREDPNEEDSVLESVIIDFFPAQDSELAESSDPVRTWFQHEVENIDTLLRMIKKSLAAKTNKGKRNQMAFVTADSEANELIIGALARSWKFRGNSAHIYGLSGKNGIDKNGTLLKADGYSAPWTSNGPLLDALADQYQISISTLDAFWAPQTEDQKRKDILNKITRHLVSLAELCCKSFEERAFWCEQQTDAREEILQQGINVRERYLASRGEWIKPLVDYGLLDQAYSIAEDHRDFRTLVEICFGELNKIDVSLAEAANAGRSAEDIERLQDAREMTAERLERYFKRFGKKFAITLYDYLVEVGMLQELVNGFDEWREQYLTPFLRGHPKYSKLAWIHDVGLGNYDVAAETLFSVAASTEEDLDHQQIELSIAKLAKLVAMERSGASGMDIEDQMDTYIDPKLKLIEIQKRLHSAVKHIRHSAIDVDAAVQLGLDEYAKRIKKMPALRETFRKTFGELVENKVLGVEDLVDLLTLIEPTDGELLNGEAFSLALSALGYAGLPRARRQFTEKTIWRRCFLRDDWTKIVSTRNRTDEDVAELARQTHVYSTILLCYKRGQFSEGSPFKPRSPEECLFSEEPKDIRLRYPQADDHQLATLAQDLYEENRWLRKHIAKADLQEWFFGMLAQVQEEAQEAQEAVIGDETLRDESTIMEIEDAEGDITMEQIQRGLY
ncbi:Non-repetitive/WGA-negative nucleoporin C-terminal-domain-containing protein [Sphaerosporella brunnea]|uniref:Non-repetitive/WGA-negative nucleoporin C-terminal-domain-containing protein n=1 Tax=Sphaerosporella brunnea TaxID=1250544 RepID=A0A5J5EKE9_9PEZI|nr:Non-repetitive/WGA-negative nucleoporin C-terminal-domain-containing protein [Sphaerosporella brunnea]